MTPPIPLVAHLGLFERYTQNLEALYACLKIAPYTSNSNASTAHTILTASRRMNTRLEKRSTRVSRTCLLRIDYLVRRKPLTLHPDELPHSLFERGCSSRPQYTSRPRACNLRMLILTYPLIDHRPGQHKTL